MADHGKENGSSGGDSQIPRYTGSSVLRPSAFNPAANSDTQPIASLTDGAMTHNNPFATARLSTSSTSADAGRAEGETTSTQSKFILRPSALDKQTSAFWPAAKTSAENVKTDSTGLGSQATSSASPFKPATSFKLEPPKLQNPLASQPHTALVSSTDEAAGSEEKKTDSAEAEVGKVAETSAVQSATSPQSSTNGSTTSTAVVFGQNLTDRVILPAAESSSSAAVDSSAAAEAQAHVFGSSCADRVLFTASSNQDGQHTVSDTANSNGDVSSSDSAGGKSQSLAESAALVQARHARPELKEVEVRTGEENESNVFQFNAKLHVFDQVKQSWLERGRGLIRLNDMAANDNRPVQSRIVMRTQGSLKVILNTLIWNGMHVEMKSPKNVQITAVDGDEGIKIFLITANPVETEQMCRAISARVEQLNSMPASTHPASTIATADSQAAAAAAVNTSSSSSASSYGSSEAPAVRAGGTQLGKRSNSASENSNESPDKKLRLDSDRGGGATGGDESNDSSALDPETEASNEGFPSSPAIQSSSSES